MMQPFEHSGKGINGSHNSKLFEWIEHSFRQGKNVNKCKLQHNAL